MDAGLLAQYVAIAFAVIVSAGYVVRRQFPDTVRRLRVALAVPLVRDGRPAWLRGLGRWLAPPVVPVGDTGCGGCSSCETPQRSARDS